MSFTLTSSRARMVSSHLGYGIIRLMNHSSSTDTAQTKKQPIPKIFWIMSALLIVLVILGGYLFATKQLVFAFGTSTEKPVTVISSICGKETIKKFNDAYTVPTSAERTVAFKNAFDAVTSTSGYAGDPNCVFIRYTYYIELKDTANAQKEVDVLKKLAAQNLYATSQLSSVRPIESMQNDITILSNPKANGSSGGQG